MRVLVGLVIFLVLVVGAAIYVIVGVLSPGGYDPEKPLPALHRAVMDCNSSEVEKLILAGADIDEVAPVMCRAGSETPLCVAAYLGEDDLVELLIAHGGDINKSSPLSYAVRNGYVSTARKLLDAGANPNVKINQEPLLEDAVTSRNVEMVELLVSKGANVQRDDPLTLIAAYAGSTEIVRILASKKVNLEVRDWRKRTPLHAAAARGHMDTVKALLELGADANTKDEEGKTPADLAAAGGYNEIVELLEQR